MSFKRRLLGPIDKILPVLFMEATTPNEEKGPGNNMPQRDVVVL